MVVRVGPFQRIVNVHWPDDGAVHYIILDTTFWEPSRDTRGDAAYDTTENSSNIVDEVLPDMHVGVFSYRTGYIRFDKTDGYTTRDYAVIASFDSSGETPSEGFNLSMLDATLAPSYPITYSVEGLPMSSIANLANPYSIAAITAPIYFEFVNDGDGISDLPGSLGATYNGVFKGTSAHMDFYSVPESALGILKYWANEFGDPPPFKTRSMAYNPATASNTYNEIIASDTFGATVTYDGHEFEVIGWKAPSGFYDAGSSADWPRNFNVQLLCRRIVSA